MKIKFLMMSLLVSIVAACSSTNMQSNSVKDIHLPKNSVGSARSALANDMISSVDLFIQRKLDCLNWSLEDVTDSKAADQLVFTKDGQIYRGKVSEKWTLQQCGKTLTLGLVITPASQGGSVIKISRY